MVSIIKVALLRKNLKSEMRDLGGEISYEDDEWDWIDGEHRKVSEEVEVYFDEYDADLEESIDNVIDKTGWECDFAWDYENNGVLFYRNNR